VKGGGGRAIRSASRDWQRHRPSAFKPSKKLILFDIEVSLLIIGIIMTLRLEQVVLSIRGWRYGYTASIEQTSAKASSSHL
jgi:hypothetical protein